MGRPKKETDNKHICRFTIRLSEKDAKTLDRLAKQNGFSPSVYVRKIIDEHITSVNADASVNYVEKIIRTTLENILEVKTNREEKLFRKLIDEIQRSNQMQLKNFIDQHPDLDVSEYRAFFYQSDKEAFELSSGRRNFSELVDTEKKKDSSGTTPEWLKTLLGEDGE